MITGLRTPTRRTIASRPQPTQSLNSRTAASYRAAFGPGFQFGASEKFVQAAGRR